MNDVLARAACALEDDPLCRQDITKDIDNEIAIAQRYRTHVGGGRSSSARVPRASAAEWPIAQMTSQSENEGPLALPAASRVDLELHRDLCIFTGRSMRDAS
jgi:hypothetical protein